MTSTNGSITATGTAMQSYYGRPVIKPPVWNPEIGFYLFTGGVAGGCGLLHGLAKLTGHREAAKAALYVGAAFDAVSPILLIKDLGRPERFLNMLRVFKVTSPMSVGSWVLLVSGGASSTAALLELLGKLKPLKTAAEAASFVSGAPLATYTAALLANTAVPVWHDARRELPLVFAGSAVASAGAATALFLEPRHAGPARRLALAGVVGEGIATQLMERKLGFVGEVYRQGEAGRFARVAKTCATAGAAVLAWKGRQSRAALAGGSALVLAGEVALRWSVFKAGWQSAGDPRYTVLPQRERLRERQAQPG